MEFLIILAIILWICSKASNSGDNNNSNASTSSANNKSSQPISDSQQTLKDIESKSNMELNYLKSYTDWFLSKDGIIIPERVPYAQKRIDEYIRNLANIKNTPGVLSSVAVNNFTEAERIRDSFVDNVNEHNKRIEESIGINRSQTTTANTNSVNNSTSYSTANNNTNERLYIYCNVIFQDNGRTYCYRTEDSSLKVGDVVWVPAGTYNEEKIVKIVSVNKYTKNNAPYPVDKTKSIIRKCTYDDMKKYAEGYNTSNVNDRINYSFENSEDPIKRITTLLNSVGTAINKKINYSVNNNSICFIDYIYQKYNVTISFVKLLDVYDIYKISVSCYNPRKDNSVNYMINSILMHEKYDICKSYYKYENNTLYVETTVSINAERNIILNLIKAAIAKCNDINVLVQNNKE